ncbi:hypothetical protein YUBABA_01440 [Serratia phage vB_SmaM-Yubaba]|nr:hypothetical protein YUBABA_01440 [Serratia phage vB_SmaM-Yubaba]
MITQQTVLMATPIALLATEKGIDLHDNVSDVIKGLNECTASIRGFTEENIAVDLPDFTATVGEHTLVLEEATDIIAERIRSALNLISKTVKPILKDVEQKLRSEIDPGNVADTIFSYLDVEMVNVEPSFLNSPYYPNAIPQNFIDIPTIRLNQLLQGTYPSMSAEDLVELIAVNVDDLTGFWSNPEEVKRIYETFFVEKNWYELFNGSAISNGSADLGNYENYAFKAFRPLVIGSLLLNRLVAMDEPLDGVTGVSLDDYRTSLRVTRDLFNAMLFKFKQIWETRAAAGVVIINDNVRLENADWGNLVGTPVLTGKLLVGYNNAVLEMFADKEEMSLSEFAAGYAYAKIRDYAVKDIITDKETVTDAWREYCGNVNTALVLGKGNVAKRIFCQVLEGLYAKEEYKPFIDIIDEHIHPTQRILSRIQQRVDLDAFFANTPMLDAIVREENSLMNTVLGAIMAGAFDSPIAEEILTINASMPAHSLVQQRKHLSRSIDLVILNRLIKL